MGKVIVVTGANRGIGLAIVRSLVSKGCTVVMGCRDEKLGIEAAAEFPKKQVNVIELDITSDESVAKFAAKLGSLFEVVDVLINNAGVRRNDDVKGQFADQSVDILKATFEINFFGQFRMIRALLPLLKKSSDPRIVNVSSGLGSLSQVGSFSPGYCASKTALNAITIHFADEFPKFKINSVCPGWIKTRLGTDAAPGTVEQGADGIVWLAVADGTPTGSFLRNREKIPW